MKIYAFADESSPIIDEQIKALLRNNLNGIEIRNVEGTSVSDITVQQAKEIRKKFDANGLELWSIGSPLGKIRFESEDFNEHLNKLKHTLEIADVLGAKNIRIFSFYPPKGKDILPYREQVFERLSKFVDTAKGTGIDLCHENEKGIYGDIASRCLKIHKAFPTLKAVFDPANFVQCKEDILSAWKLLKPYVKYVHIKDALADGTVVPAGCGNGNIREILSDFNGNVTIEPHLKVFLGLDALENDDIEKSGINDFAYSSNEQAFDAACNHLKEIIK